MVELIYGIDMVDFVIPNVSCKMHGRIDKESTVEGTKSPERVTELRVTFQGAGIIFKSDMHGVVLMISGCQFTNGGNNVESAAKAHDKEP